MQTIQSSVLILLGFAIQSAHAQDNILSHTSMMDEAFEYVSTSGNIPVLLGTSSEDVIGAAMLCRRNGGGEWELDSRSLIPLPGATNVNPRRIDVSDRPVFERSSRSVIDAGASFFGVTTRAEDSALSILRIRPTSQYRVQINVLALEPISRYHYNLYLQSNPEYDQVCFIRDATIWTVEYENFRSRSFSANADGVWITRGGASYSRVNSVRIPREFMTVLIQPVPGSVFSNAISNDRVQSLSDVGSVISAVDAAHDFSLRHVDVENALNLTDGFVAMRTQLLQRSVTDTFTDQRFRSALYDQIQFQQRIPDYQIQLDREQFSSD